jgi:imidazolonepropionase
MPDSQATLLTGIGQLVTNDPQLGDQSALGVLADAALVVIDARVAWVGSRTSAPACDQRVEFAGRTVLPAFVDSHTHLVYAGDRAAEFTARMAGRRYDGGGIAATVTATRAASDDHLRVLLRERTRELWRQGTGTVEIKSGYGLDIEQETRLLRLAAEVTDETTFLGAHVVPPEFAADRDGYLALVTGPMLAACAPYARWLDVFCEPASPHAFDGDEAAAVLAAGRAAGLAVRVHAGQLDTGPGVQVAVAADAASVDHCTHLRDADVDCLAGSATVATLLPGADFGTRSAYPNGRRLVDAGVTVALATDANPGTSPSTSMPFCIALAVRECGLTPAEALWAATAGGAQALRRSDIGRLSVAARALLTVLDAPSYVHLAYRPGVPLTHGWRPEDQSAQASW